MNSVAAGFLTLPDVSRLLPRQQMAIDCAVCARPLGANGQVMGDVLHLGFLYRLWVCMRGCEAGGPASGHQVSRGPTTTGPGLLL
ncbi:hypothetical protein [Streptomyces sp. 1222.5]|uniref:hypothetical protein n=1 Tax=Streptomyces sp. 1222.5 TaxID=1881026 RepID=UPI003D71F790